MTSHTDIDAMTETPERQEAVELQLAIRRLLDAPELRKDLLDFICYWECLDAYTVPVHVSPVVRDIVQWLLIKATEREARATLAQMESNDG